MTDQTPQRIQRLRTKGFRLPPDTVCVSRPGKLGNPFDWRKFGRAKAVDLFRKAVFQPRDYAEIVPTHEQIRAELAGKKFVACWCRLDEPCHGDVLIEVANPHGEKAHPDD